MSDLRARAGKNNRRDMDGLLADRLKFALLRDAGVTSDGQTRFRQSADSVDRPGTFLASSREFL
jgi:hypothetical protein